MANRPAITHSTAAMRRSGRAVAATLATMAALTLLSAGATAKTQRHVQPPEETAPRPAGEPIMAIVSIKSQQVTFYDADGWILRAPVSTGVKGRETPAGIFAVLEKDKDHHSSMYDDAWMPNMQRITWNGIALHGGPLPGYAASHGCIRMPYDFAEKMFDKTRIGMRVIISPNDAAPVDFSHPALFEPNAEVLAAAPVRAETLGREAAEAATASDDAKKASAAAGREAASLAAAVRKLEKLNARAGARLVAADKALAAADKAKARADDLKQKAVAQAAELAPQLDAARADAQAKLDAATAAKVAAVDDAAKKAAATRAGEAASLAKAASKLEVATTRADAKVAAADKAIAAAVQAQAKAAALKDKALAAAADLAKQLDAARIDAQAKADLAAAAKGAAKVADARKTETTKAASEAKLDLEPVSVYISRATQTLYVRRNTHKRWPDGGEVFDASIEVPITIRDPDRPIGTHVFTAMARAGAALRWSAVTIDDGDDARDALDRISIPQDLLDRIAPTALPRSSIVISDEPLSRETNYRTEFVAVLSDYPQGGFITRKPTPPPRPARGFDLFSGFGGNQKTQAGNNSRRNQGDWFQQFWQ